MSKPNHTVSTGGRNLGIDALRIVSMLMVLILHISASGGVIAAAESNRFRFLTVWMLYNGATCAVNCYGLISGYVGINSKYKYTNIITLWLQVAFYDVIFTMISFLLKTKDVGLQQLLYSFFPLYKGKLWYFRSYVGLFFFMPLINHFVHSIKRKQAVILCLTLMVAFSVIPAFSNTDPFNILEGFSTLWLILLYVFGACIRKFDFFSNIKSSILVMGYAICVCITTIASYFGSSSMKDYNSIFMLLCGIALLLFFSRINVRSRLAAKMITFVSPLAFGVYIIHMHPYVNNLLFNSNIFNRIGEYFPVVLACGVLLSAILLFAICTAIDWLRLFLFQKLKIKQRTQQLEAKYIGDIWNTPSES